jgi:hypothetical protein
MKTNYTKLHALLITKDVLPYVIPLTCILTIENKNKDFINILNDIKVYIPAIYIIIYNYISDLSYWFYPILYKYDFYFFDFISSIIKCYEFNEMKNNKK